CTKQVRHGLRRQGWRRNVNTDHKLAAPASRRRWSNGSRQAMRYSICGLALIGLVSSFGRMIVGILLYFCQHAIDKFFWLHAAFFQQLLTTSCKFERWAIPTDQP